MAMKHYAHMHKVKPGWLFLTGSADDMETVRRKLGYVDPDPEVDKDKSQSHRGDQIWQRTIGTMGRVPGNAIARMDCGNAQLGRLAKEPRQERKRMEVANDSS